MRDHEPQTLLPSWGHPVKISALCICACSLLLSLSVLADRLTIAAASDLKFAMEEIIPAFERDHPGAEVEAVFGSSGNINTQIRQGAPYDLFFSADIAFPRELVRDGLTASEVVPYAVGRIVLWSTRLDTAKMTLNDLADPTIERIAIANPKHAPYGKRAEEALRAAGLWERVAPKLILGETIVQAAQFVQTGNAQVGIIALSLVSNPELARKGGYAPIPDSLHQPLEQGFVITRHGASSTLARAFADYVASPPVRAVLARYGFVLPGERAGGARSFQ